jgi:ZIP family zinc transporter
MLIAVGVALHNIPEGMAVGTGFAHMPKFGLLLAIAIGLHNVPEGIATTMFIRCGGKRRRDCLKITFLSGIVEPIGAIAAFLFLKQFMFLIPVSLAFAGGVMVFITLDEIIPMAREHGRAHLTSIGIILGAVFMLILHGVMV